MMSENKEKSSVITFGNGEEVGEVISFTPQWDFPDLEIQLCSRCVENSVEMYLCPQCVEKIMRALCKLVGVE